MRKLMFPVLIILIISMCSCRSSSQVNPVTKPISFTAETLWDGTEYSVNVSTDDDLKTTFTVTSPEKIRNFKLAFSGDVVYLFYSELEHEIGVSDLPENSPFKIIYEGLNAASKENTRVYSENDKYFIKYNTSCTGYILFFGETGLPLEITDKNGENKILFKGVTILN